MVNTDKHVRVVKSTDELARAIDQIRTYREEFAERHAEAHGGYAPKKREYPEETVVLSPDGDAEPHSRQECRGDAGNQGGLDLLFLSRRVF